MSETCDVNVLVYATNGASAQHHASRELIGRLAVGPALVRLLWPVVFRYLRLVTHPSVLAAPLSPAEAQANISDLIDRPHVRMVGEADGFWSFYSAVAHDVRPRGKLVPDAHLVALMHQHGITTMWTYDRDFRKFSGITVREPSLG